MLGCDALRLDQGRSGESRIRDNVAGATDLVDQLGYHSGTKLHRRIFCGDSVGPSLNVKGDCMRYVKLLAFALCYATALLVPSKAQAGFYCGPDCADCSAGRYCFDDNNGCCNEYASSEMCSPVSVSCSGSGWGCICRCMQCG